jgi:hypothetical protein
MDHRRAFLYRRPRAFRGKAHMRDDKSRRVKKSETLEVRIPYETKQAFLTACREDGTTASEVVRGSVQTYLDERARPTLPEKRTPAMNIISRLPQPVRRYGPRALAGGAIAVGFTAMAVLPSAADPDFQIAFNRLDANGDGVLTAEEFLGARTRDGAMGTLSSKAGPSRAPIPTLPTTLRLRPRPQARRASARRPLRFISPAALPAMGPNSASSTSSSRSTHRRRMRTARQPSRNRQGRFRSTTSAGGSSIPSTPTGTAR